MVFRGLFLWLVALLLVSPSAKACMGAEPIKITLTGEVLSSEKLAQKILDKLPCRQQSSALACMCRPIAKAVVEVTIGFKWKGTQMSDISTKRLQELGKGLRSIEGFSSVSVKNVSTRNSDNAVRVVISQRKKMVGDMVKVTAKQPLDLDRPVLNKDQPTKTKWVRQKFVVNAVFV